VKYARIEAAEACRREADEQLARSESELAQAVRDFDRTRLLAKDHIVSDQQLEQAESRGTAAAKDVEAARFRVQSAAADVEREKAGLISSQTQEHNTSRLVSVRAPARCRILRILENSERLISFGTPIVILSDPHKIEVVVDVLSTDAVKIKPGAPVIIEHWGEPRPLYARVRVVEPYGFTKISALGIEEQRVNSSSHDFPVGYSSADCSPAGSASASPNVVTMIPEPTGRWDETTYRF